jgi:hypothetical protein
VFFRVFFKPCNRVLSQVDSQYLKIRISDFPVLGGCGFFITRRASDRPPIGVVMRRYLARLPAELEAEQS